MTVTVESPNPLKAYEDFGMDFVLRQNDSQAWGDCPLCGEEDKFCVAVATGLWDCKKCLASSNVYGFLREFHKVSLKHTSVKDYMQLCTQRGVLYPESLRKWGFSRNILTGEWMIPGYGVEGRIQNVYRYTRNPNPEKSGYVFMSVTGLTQKLFGVNLFDKKKPDIYQCEGVWDAIVLWEILRLTKKDKERFFPSYMREPNLLTTANVLATPGAGTFPQAWNPLYSGKNIYLSYDSDYPHKDREGKEIKGSGAGYAGMKRATGVLTDPANDNPPKSIHYLKWGKDGYDTSKPDGFDLRDYFKEAKSAPARLSLIPPLLEKFEVVPDVWKKNKGNASKNGKHTGNGKVAKKEPEKLQVVHCESWEELIEAWKLAMEWTDGLELGLACMCAIAASTMLIGDQVWLKPISPPSTGKTILAEAMEISDWVISQSTFTGLHSGWSPTGEDNSLLEKIKGKTLIIKDGDTILSNPNKDKLLGELRDAFDTNSRTHYKHGVNFSYEGYRFTFIFAGTESMKQIDKSELGQRFLDLRMVDKIDDDLEDRIGWAKINQVCNVRGIQDDTVESRYAPEMMKAYQLTGGFVNWLRTDTLEKYNRVKMRDEFMRHIVRLGKFVSFMRARLPTRQEEIEANREMSPRLISQLGKLTLCLGMVYGKDQIDREIMRIITKVGLDTSSGKTLDIVNLMRQPRFKPGIDPRILANIVFRSEAKGMEHIKFLRQLEVMESFAVGSNLRWKITDKIDRLYSNILEYA